VWDKVPCDHRFVTENYNDVTRGLNCKCGEKLETVCTRCFASAINGQWHVREEVYATKLADAIRDRNDAVRIKEAEKLILLEEIKNHTATREKLEAAERKLKSVADAVVVVPSDYATLREEILTHLS
jgi:hypothetical protein